MKKSPPVILVFHIHTFFSISVRLYYCIPALSWGQLHLAFLRACTCPASPPVKYTPSVSLELMFRFIDYSLFGVQKLLCCTEWEHGYLITLVRILSLKAATSIFFLKGWSSLDPPKNRDGTVRQSDKKVMRKWGWEGGGPCSLHVGTLVRLCLSVVLTQNSPKFVSVM